MKKLIFLEMAALSILLVIAVLVASKIDRPKFSQDNAVVGSIATESTHILQTEAAQTDPTWNTYPADRQLTAQQFFAYDCKARTYLANSGAENDWVYPAGITKLFTAYVAMQYLHAEAVFNVGDAIDLIPSDSPVADLQKGDKLTARRLLEGMLITGGNDATYMLACEAGRIIKGNSALDAASAVQAFVDEMNRRAKTLGMANTHFVNPDGAHDPQHYTTVKDLITLATKCLIDNTIMHSTITAQTEFLLRGRTVVWKNPNELINPKSSYYCPYAKGLVAGQATEAGSYTLSIFHKNGQYLVIGVFGSSSPTDCFDDTLQLFNQIVLK